MGTAQKKTTGAIEAVLGMGLLLLGHKAKGLMTFGHGVYSLEEAYREVHPELEPGIQARWGKAIEFYEETHQEETNRTLHRWGIPLILGGAIGLIACKSEHKSRKVSAGIFAFGWFLNILGHAAYEKNKPAFTDDPLSFIAGPIWDLKQLTANSSSPMKESTSVVIDTP